MCTCQARLHRREYGHGHAKMAVFLGFLHFHRVGLEMISSSPVKMRHSAISTCPPFPPPTEDRPALNMVGRHRPWGAWRYPIGPLSRTPRFHPRTERHHGRAHAALMFEKEMRYRES